MLKRVRRAFLLPVVLMVVAGLVTPILVPGRVDAQ
jgi:hypothetical protein